MQRACRAASSSAAMLLLPPLQYKRHVKRTKTKRNAFLHRVPGARRLLWVTSAFPRAMPRICPAASSIALIPAAACGKTKIFSVWRSRLFQSPTTTTARTHFFSLWIVTSLTINSTFLPCPCLLKFPLRAPLLLQRCSSGKLAACRFGSSGLKAWGGRGC